MRQFKLSDTFLENYKDKQPKWGPLGACVYYRTYSRLKDDNTQEEFWETVKRVVEGTYSIQKEHCKNLGVEWNNEKAQNSAQEMYRRIWDFKFLPPGRGLWMMGTETLERHSAGLFNCAYRSTETLHIDLAEPFCWVMEFLMLGTGCGFGAEGAGSVVIKKPSQSTETFVVPDTREGWVDALRSTILPFSGKGALPSHYDFSLVRKAGEPIKGFGGISSGPEPLKELLDSVNKILTNRIGQKITVTDINDIMNLVGRCVVSGNVRRSAEISLGNADDDEFLNLKNPEINQERLMHHGWAANNSVFSRVGMDYSRTADMTAKNGEPGYVWLDNCKKYSRFKDPIDNKDYRAAGCNPCFSGDTLIAVADGRNAVSIKQLADEGVDVPVYSLNPTNGLVEIKWGRNPRITGYNQDLIRIHFKEGGFLDVTPNHKMILKNGESKEAKDLVSGDRLPRFTKNLERITNKDSNANKYYRVHTNTLDSSKGKIFEHVLISKFHQPEIWNSMYDENKNNGWILGGLVVHHKDYNPLNNSPNNLQIMTFKDHAAYHAKHDNNGENNGMYGRQHTEETKKLIGAKSKERLTNPEYKRKFLEALKNGVTEQSRVAISNARKKEWDKYYSTIENSEMVAGLETFRNSNNILCVKKQCEACGNSFVAKFAYRERAYCGKNCANKALNSRDTEIANIRKNNQREVLNNSQLETLNKQILIYKELENILNRPPMQAEWFSACKAKNIPFRFRGKVNTNNPYTLKNFSDLKIKASEFNHCVDRIEFLSKDNIVYNITVDKNHTVGIVVPKEGNKNVSGIFTYQCGEQVLENGECCCLVEVFPANHDSYKDYETTLKYAYLYGKTVTLLKTHSALTNAVMQRNRRIGTSNSGIVQAINKFGRREFFEMCDKGYQYLQELDKQYSEWFCIPRSIKMTTVKPSGSTSLLPGNTPGIHFPHSEYYIRRIRFQDSSPMLKAFEKNGYKIEKDAYSPNTVCVEFPVKEEYYTRGKYDVSMWEQLELAAQMQYYWSDNSVSITVTVKPEESKDIKNALELYETRLKTVSFLPLEDHKYVQAPYETITKEQYYEMMSRITPVTSFSESKHEVTEIFCSNDVCEIRTV